MGAFCVEPNHTTFWGSFLASLCVISKTGDAGDQFYVVSAGHLEASVAVAEATARALDVEDQLLFRSYSRAEFFAEYVLFAPRAAIHPFSVRAVDAAELLIMPQATFATVAEDEPAKPQGRPRVPRPALRHRQPLSGRHRAVSR